MKKNLLILSNQPEGFYRVYFLFTMAALSTVSTLGLFLLNKLRMFGETCFPGTIIYWVISYIKPVSDKERILELNRI